LLRLQRHMRAQIQTDALSGEWQQQIVDRLTHSAGAVKSVVEANHGDQLCPASSKIEYKESK